MIEAGTGLARDRDPGRAARRASGEAMRRLTDRRSAPEEYRDARRGSDLALVFCAGVSESSLPAVLEEVRAVTGVDNPVGCSGAGVLTEAGEIENEQGVSVLVCASDTLQTFPFLVDGLKGRDRDVGREIGRLIREKATPGSLLLVFPDSISCHPDHLFAGIQEVAGSLPVAGGGAAAEGASGLRTLQFCGQRVVSNAVSGVLLSGAIAHSVGVTQSCLPLGKPYRITAAEGNAIKTLNGRPAVRSLIESLAGPGGELSEDLHRLASHVFVGLPTGDVSSWKHGDYIVRSILGVDPDDGAVYVGCEVREGGTIGFMLRDPAGAREDLKSMLQHSDSSCRQPALGFYFNCCARGAGLYGLPEIDTAYIRNALPALPVVGFFGFSEVAPANGGTRTHNYSGVMALVSESASA